MPNLGLQELIIVGILAILLFGKRLPEVARSLGQSYHEFRRGLQDLKGEVDSAVYSARSSPSSTSTRYLPHDRHLDDPVESPFPTAESLPDTSPAEEPSGVDSVEEARRVV